MRAEGALDMTDMVAKLDQSITDAEGRIGEMKLALETADPAGSDALRLLRMLGVWHQSLAALRRVRSEVLDDCVDPPAEG